MEEEDFQLMKALFEIIVNMISLLWRISPIMEFDNAWQ